MATDTLEPQQVKGVPPGLIAEPLTQPHGQVRGVPAGLIAEPIGGAAPAAKTATPSPAPSTSGTSRFLNESKTDLMTMPAHWQNAPQQEIYDATINEGQTPERAKTRVQEYEAAKASGFSEDKAKKFAYAKTWNDQPKVKLTDEQKQKVAQEQIAKVKAISQKVQDHSAHPFSVGLPSEDEQRIYDAARLHPEQYAKDYAEGYAYARANGWSEADAVKYAEHGAVGGRMAMRAESALGEKFETFSNWLDRTAEKHGVWKPKVKERIAAPNIAEAVGAKPEDVEMFESGGGLTTGLVGAATGNIGLGLRASSWMNRGDSKAARLASTVDSHLAHFIGGLTSPQNLTLMAATEGLGAFEGGAAAEGAEATRVMPVPVQQVARTIKQGAHVGFTLQMAGGTTEALGAAKESYQKGQYEDSIGYALDALLSGVMVTQGVRHSVAEANLTADLNRYTEQVYGTPAQPEGEGPTQKAATEFSKLNPYQQAVVITKMTEESPEYKQAMEGSEKQAAKAAKKMAYRQQMAVAQSWNPNAAARAIRDIHEQRVQAERERVGEQFVQEALKAAREHMERQRAEARTARPQARQEAAAERSEVGRVAKSIADDREKTWQQRTEAQEEQQSTEGPTRTVETAEGPDGGVAYPAMYWGEQNLFGIFANEDGGHSVYRHTDRGTEWLDSDGNFSESPTEIVAAQDQQVADTLARLSALSANADTLADEENATPEQKRDAEELARIRRELVSGEIDSREAQKQAGIAEKVKLPDEYTAARDGRLNGPFHESSPVEYQENLRAEAEEAGMEEDEIKAVTEEAGMLARQQTEQNLHHVYRPGDYVVSKRGVKWTLDSKGMLHPDDGGQPVSLMKRGLYSNDAIQLAQSGRVGYGFKTREERRADNGRRNKAIEDIRANQEAVNQEMRLAAQQAGLQSAPEEEPRVDAEAKRQRESRLMSKVPERRPESGRAAVKNIVNAAFKAPADPYSIINMGAARAEVSPEEYMRLALANDPERSQTVEAKVARLEPGDTISDAFRPNAPWTVEEGKDGKMYLRSGNASPLPLDRLNPSDRVRQLVAKGEVTAVKPEFTEDDVARAAFDKPFFVRNEERLTEEVQDRAAGKIVDPEPKTKAQAKQQETSAKVRQTAADAVATRAVVEALDPVTTSVEEAEKAVDKAEEQIQVAKEAHAQTARATGVVAGKEAYPEKAPVSIGKVGAESYVQTDGERIPVHYELVPLKAVTVSFQWNGNNLERNPAYPAYMQDVPIDERLRMRLLDDARPGVYDIAQYGDAGLGPERGPAVVDNGGVVVGGNRRLLRMQKYLENVEAISDPDDRDVARAMFKDDMRRIAAKNGIADYPDDGEVYVAVRKMDDPIETQARATELGSLLNDSASDRIQSNAKSVTFGKLLNEAEADERGRGVPGVLTRIANAINNADSLNDAMDKDSQFFTDIVKKYFNVSRTEEAGWLKTDNRGFTVLHEEGRKKFAMALLSTVIRDTATLERIYDTPAFRSLVKAVGPLTQLRSFEDRNIIPKVEEAISVAAATEDKRVDGDTSRSRWNKVFNEPDMFDENPPEEPDKATEAIWRAMHDKRPTRLKVALDDLLLGETQNLNMFAPTEAADRQPYELFNEAFRPELEDVRDARGVEEATEAVKASGREAKPEEIKEYLRGMSVGLTPAEFAAALKGQDISDIEREAAPEDETPYGDRSVDGLEPWQMTKDEYHDQHLEDVQHRRQWTHLEKVRDQRPDPDRVHYDLVKNALAEGKPVPAAVLADYDAAAMENLTPIAREYLGEPLGKMEPPPAKPTPESKAATALAVAKTEQGYVTSSQLKQFIESHPATKDSANELMRTARMMAEYVYDVDPPIGVDRKDALDWILRERLAGIERGVGKVLRNGKWVDVRGGYSDPNIEEGFGTGIMKLYKAADVSTFIHEFSHVVFPMLSDEDLKAIDTIEGEDGKGVWDGTRKGLTGKTYKALSEKFAYGMEAFLRDENPTGFTSEVKAVLAKVKAMMKKVYMAFAGDPLHEYKNTEESRQVFADMFGITDFDVADDYMKDLRQARAEEKRMKKPSEEPHPLVKAASEAGATGLSNTMAGKVEDSFGPRIDPRKPTAVLKWGAEDADKANEYWAKINGPDSKVEAAELIHAEDGSYGVRFNTKTRVPPDLLYQDIPKPFVGLELEKAKKELADTPERMTALRNLRQLRVQNLENQIRAQYGAEPLEQQPTAEAAREALTEVKNEKGDNGVRKAADEGTGVPQPQGLGRLPQPPRRGQSGNAGAGRIAPRPQRVPTPTSLAEVTPVGLQALPRERGQAVGTVTGEAFDRKGWVDGLKAAGLPETLPAPTWALDRKTADKLIFPGQKQVVQTALSALEQGDGAVVATATGSGKGFTSMAAIREWRNRNPDAKVLFLTKNSSLLKTAGDIATNSFGFEFEDEMPDANAPAGVYGSTYSRIIRSDAAKSTKWDLVVADESGEARRWYADENKQGKALKDITANSGKALYFSATPFHSPMEYGYLDKLGLWPKGGFDRWIQQNFAHENIDGKIIAKLDPGKQAKLRQQLIERGQLVSQAISYDGFTAHFGVVPVTDAMKRGLDRIHEGFARAKKQLVDMKKKGLAEKAAALEATYTKAYLERERLPQAVELARKARANGWQVILFSETSSEDLFRRPTDDPGTYQQLDMAMGGQLARIIPPFADVYNTLKAEFGDEIGDYSGRGNTDAERERAKADFLAGETPMLYTTYAAGGIGVSLHDADYPELGIKGGDKPRVAIFLGPPYSGVLLEQAMGRTWRFGVKSDTHAVFLATDSEPDVRLMQQKVGPRMRALRASVLGEKDSLAQSMATYTDDEKVRARQEALAYSEGNEADVNAASYQVRSKSRNVGINDWSLINFPPADEAKNKGMKYGEDVTGGDWSNLYQDREKAWMQPPDSPEVMAGSAVIDAIGNGIESGESVPPSLQNLEPTERTALVGGASAMAAEELKLPRDRDPRAVARQSMKSSLNIPHNMVLTYEERRTKMGSKVTKAVWKFPDGVEPTKVTSPEDEDGEPQNVNTVYIGAGSMKGGIESIARQAGVPEVGLEITQRIGKQQRDMNMIESQMKWYARRTFTDNGLDPGKETVVSEVMAVAQNKRTSDNPAINKAAAELRDWFDMARDGIMEAGVKKRDSDGNWKPWAPRKDYWPHMIDWDAEVEYQDPETGVTERHKLKEVMKPTFDEKKRQAITARLASLAKDEDGNAVSASAMDKYLRQKYRRGTPVQGNVQEERTLDFPIIRQDFDVLNNYATQVAKAISIERHFGSDRGKINAEIAKIPSDNGRRDITVMFDSLLSPQELSGRILPEKIFGIKMPKIGWNQFTNAMNTFTVLTKMSLSFAKVPFHALHMIYPLHGDVRPMVKALGRLMIDYPQAHEDAVFLGTLARQVDFTGTTDAGQGKGVSHWAFQVTGFNAAYNVGRVWADNAARIWMEQYAMRGLLKPGKTAEFRRVLKETLLVGDHAIDQAIANKGFSKDDIQKAQVAFANETMFTDNPTEMPAWARMPITSETSGAAANLYKAMRTAYSMASFTVKTRRMLKKYIVDETFRYHNPKMLPLFLVMEPIIGAGVATAGAGVKSLVQVAVGHRHDENALDREGQMFRRAWKDHGMKGDVEKAELYLDMMTYGIAQEQIKMLGDMVLNVAANPKKATTRQGLEHLGSDLLESIIGPIWNSTVKKPIEFSVDEAIIFAKGGPQKHKKELARLWKQIVSEIPVLSSVPQALKMTHPPGYHPPRKQP